MSISRSLNRIFDKGRDERREPPVPTTSIADKLKSSEEPPKAPTPAPRFAPKGSDTGGGFEGEPSTTVQPTVSIPKPTEPAPVSVAPAITQTQQILQREGFTSAEDARQQILKREFKRRGIKEDQALTARSILSDLGIESAQDILDIEEQRKQEKIAEAERKKALQVEEQEFARKQQEYIDNLDPNNFKLPGQNTYETKFGEIDFDKAEFSRDNNFTFKVKTEDKELYFVPQEFVFKGAKYEDFEGYDRSVINKDFLDVDHLTGFLKAGQLIDLDNNATKYKNLDKEISARDVGYNRDNLNIGYLLTREDYNKYMNPGSFRYLNRSGKRHEGEILGLNFDSKNNRLIYLSKPNIKADQSQAYFHLTKEGRVTNWTEWYNKPSGFFGIFKGIPILGDIDKALLDVTEFFAEIPLAPEIAAILIPGDPGSKAAIYAGLKGLQARGMGGDAEDVLKAAGIAYATSSIKLDKLGEKVGASLGIADAAISKAVGTALTYSAFNGIMAAATGGDVADAMLSGAIMGGLSQSGAEVTNKIFGAGDSVKGAQNVAKLADQLNLKPQQFQKIFMNSTISASISASRGGDFFKQFTNSAIAQGISTASANKMKTALEGAGMSEQNVKALTRATYNLVNAAAYSAIRGTSVEDALKVVGQKEVQRQVASRLKQA
jgi:hypothetical protein